MTAVLIALADVGPGVQLEELLNNAGAKARWDVLQADGPRGGTTAAVVLVDADHLKTRLAEVASLWRDLPSVPGVVAIGSSASAREHAPHARVTLVSPSAKIATLAAAIKDAARLRLASGMRWPVLRAAVGMPPTEDSRNAWPATLLAARNVDIEIPRTALRWHVAHYATPTEKLDELRTERLLTGPELASVAKIDGTLTVQSVVQSGPLDPAQMARLLWTLCSMGALDFTPEVRDVATAPRRALREMRNHVRARSQRLERSTFYDVLELTPAAEYPEIEDAYRLLGTRFSPAFLDRYDLAEVAPLVQPMWELVEKARSVLVDDAARLSLGSATLLTGQAGIGGVSLGNQGSAGFVVEQLPGVLP